jgi:hypothetical protein
LNNLIYSESSWIISYFEETSFGSVSISVVSSDDSLKEESPLTPPCHTYACCHRWKPSSSNLEQESVEGESIVEVESD